MFIEPRKSLINWVRKQLIGPPEPATDGPELHGVLPTERFPCGALYPTSHFGEGIDPASEDVDEAEGTTEVTGESSSGACDQMQLERLHSDTYHAGGGGIS